MMSVLRSLLSATRSSTHGPDTGVLSPYRSAVYSCFIAPLPEVHDPPRLHNFKGLNILHQDYRGMQKSAGLPLGDAQKPSIHVQQPPPRARHGDFPGDVAGSQPAAVARPPRAVGGEL